ncbi:MAG: DUF11 domain-containing protein [Pseudomonadales bacterium]|nr:DUF11 domain-containing protein [Pseudomonadales bacterium]
MTGLLLWMFASSAMAASSLSVTVTPTSPASDLEAGNAVFYDITVTNNGDSPAFDVLVGDAPPADFGNCLLNSVTNGSGAGDPFAGGYTFATFSGATANALDPGDNVVLNVRCNLQNGVEDSAAYTNGAHAVWADTLGGPTFPAEVGVADVTTRALSIAKSIVVTSEAHTSELTSPRPLVTGEIVRYRLVVDVLQGNPRNLLLTDVLPTGLAYVSGSQTLLGLVTDSGGDLAASNVVCLGGTAARVGNDTTDLSTLGLDCVIAPASGGSGSGDDPVFDLGDILNSEHDLNSELIVLELNARVVGDVVQGTALANAGTVTTDNASIPSASVPARQAGPVLQVTRSVVPADVAAGTRVEYVVTVRHAPASDADAFDISVNDVLPATLTYDALAGITGPQAPAVPGTDVCTAAGAVINDGDPNGVGLNITFAALPQGEVCEIRYFATTDAGLAGGQTIPTTTDVDYTSLPVNGTDPNATGSPPGVEAADTTQAQATVTIQDPVPVKSIAATALTETPDNTSDTPADPRPTAIGEWVRYRLLTRIPEGTLTGVTVTDQLPAGMVYVSGSARVALVADAGGVVPAPAIVCAGGTINKAGNDGSIASVVPDCALEPAGGPFGSGDDPAWSLGDLVNTDGDNNAEYVLIEYDALPVNEAGNQDGVVMSGAYAFDFGASNLVSNTVANVVREPHVTTGVVTVPSPMDNRTNASPAVQFVVALGNDGTSPAWQVGAPGGGGVVLTLPAGLREISNVAVTATGNALVSGSNAAVAPGDVVVSTTTNNNDTLTLTPLLRIDPGAVLEIRFDAVLMGNVPPGAVLNGASVVTYASLATGNAGNGTRTAADQASGSGNTPMTSAAVLNDYRSETAYALSVVGETPDVTIVHAVSAPPSNDGNGNYTLTYRLTVTNSGDVDLDNVVVVDDLDATFGTGDYSVSAVRVTSPGNTLVADPGYTGAAGNQTLLLGTSTLAPGVAGVIEIDVIASPAAGAGVYGNAATVNAASARTGSPVTDTDSGNVSLSVNDGGIGLAKAAGATVPNFDGTFSNTITLTVTNPGTTPISNVRVTDAVAGVIAPAVLTGISGLSATGGLTQVNPAFDGTSSTNVTPGTETLTAGATATITFTMTWRPNGATGPFQNIAVVTGETPSNPNPGVPDVTDTSTDGLDADPDGNGDPGDNSTPTPFTFSGGVDGTVAITDQSIPGDTLDLTVVDADENTDAATPQTVTVTVVNDATGEAESRTLTETGVNTGVFTGTLPTLFGAAAGPDDDGALTTQKDDTVTVTYTDRLTATGGVAGRTDTGVVVGVAGIAGTSWLDTDEDNAFDPEETPLDGWIVRVVRNGTPVRDVTVAADGAYAATNLTPGSGYDVVLVHPQSGAAYNQLTGITLLPEVMVVDQNLPIDPSGILYDSNTRLPIAGVTVNFVAAGTGDPVPAACLLAGQQGQITGTDGWYRFDVQIDARPECVSGTTFLIVPVAPAGYNAGYSTQLPPQPGPLDPSGLPDPVAVGAGPTPPAVGDPVTYFVSFTLAAGDPNVIWNHIPLDAVATAASGVRLDKRSHQSSTTVGGLVAYTLTITNNTPLTLPGVSIVDTPPAGFAYVDGSATTTDGGALAVAGTRPVTFSGFDLAPGQSREIRYLTRVNAGVVHGEYINTAIPFVGPAPVGAPAQARVTVTADPDFEETTIIGKVFNDVDGDGWQDVATASDVVLRVWTEGGGFSGVVATHGDGSPVALPGSLTSGIPLGDLPGRYGVNDLTGRNQVVVSGRLPEGARVTRAELVSRDGGHVVVDGEGTRSQPERRVKAGTNGQKLRLRLESRRTTDGRDMRITAINDGVDETGVPGVRLATVEGLLVETDAFGRFHLAGIDSGFMERGRNFILKVDPSTLPSGSEFTTENPRVRRLSQGLMNQFDFGVRIPGIEHGARRVNVKIAEMFFKPDSAEVLPGYRDMLRVLAEELKKGTIVNLWVEAYTNGRTMSEEAATLARRRARALIDALCEMAGADVAAQIRVRTRVPEDARGMNGDTAAIEDLVLRGLDWLLAAIVPPVQAATGTCLQDICRDKDGVPVIVIENEDGSLYEPSAELPDRGRVDLMGERLIRLEDGGSIWWTEDPAALAPQLSLVGPAYVPVRDGVADDDLDFVVYSNYSAFIANYRLDIHAALDADLARPIASLDIDNQAHPRQVHRVHWSVKGATLPEGDRVRYVLRAFDAEGREDVTRVQQALFVEAGQHADADMNGGLPLEVSLVNDNVVIFLPGEDQEKVLAHTAHFADFGTELSAADKAALDDIADALQSVPRVSILAHGHTSTKRIAPRSRHITADNDELSCKRADAVADYLATRLGDRVVSVEKMGSGPRQPVAENVTEAGQAQNRRALAAARGFVPVTPEQVTTVPRDTAGGSQGGGIAAGGLALALARNDLASHTIPVYGSRLRVQGSELGAGYRIDVLGNMTVVDDSGRFASETLLPVGHHVIPLIVESPDGDAMHHDLAMDITGNYRFLVALADLTLSDNSITGAVQPLSTDDHYDDGMLLEGRLAFYLKGKVQGKYLVTAQLDTREEALKDIFDDIHRKDARSLFRRLDPDRYYPVYGDDSTTIADVNTYGRMYARVEWDHNEVVWGNYETGLTGNELLQYSRGLYGARGHYESPGTTGYGDRRTSATGFVSENQTALGHSEFLGTGGSLYYLRHTDLLPGSDKARVEIRDPRSNRVIDNRTLQQGMDYEIDELQGRVVLSRPLMQMAQASAPSLVSEGSLAGNEVVLVVDYEYVPDSFDANQLVVGGSARQWLGDHVAVGGTLVKEGRSGDDYALGGVDVTLKGGENTWAKVEYGRSEATQTNRYLSTDGGMTFSSINTGTASRDGDAMSVDIHVNAGDFGGPVNWITNAWAKDVDDHYSVARRDDGANVKEAGVETQMPLGDKWKVGARATHYEVAGRANEDRVAATVERKVGDRGRLTAETQHAESETPTLGNAKATLGAVQYEHRITEGLVVYGGGQLTLDASSNYDNNDQAVVGARVSVTEATQAEVELRDGHRGSGALAGVEHRLNTAHTLYGTVTHSTDTTEDPFLVATGPSLMESIGTNFTAGHRWTPNDRMQLFTEGQFNRGPMGSGLGHAFGLDYALPHGWNAGFTLQDNELQTAAGMVDRSAYSLGVGYSGERLRYASRLEYRDDNGPGLSAIQWLTTNRADYRFSDNYRAAARFNFGRTENDITGANDGRLVEASVGIAYRPVGNNRLNWLTKYTYVYDLQSVGQENADTDRRLQVLSWEGIYKLTPQFDLGVKLAEREGEVRIDRDAGGWFGSRATFAAGSVRWHVLRNWDALVEYRWLNVDESDSNRAGWLVSVDRQIGDYFSVGIGYSFVDFSDDLTQVDYDFKGWFLNAVGKY